MNRLNRTLDRLAMTGVIIASSLTLLCTVRLAGVTSWVGLPLTTFFTLLAFRLDKITSLDLGLPKTPEEVADQRLNFWHWGLFLLLLLLTVVPVLYSCVSVLRLAPEGGYLFSDDAYEVEIAQGLKRSFPPPDLGYAGRTLHYHYGHALWLDLANRYFNIPFSFSLYLLMPLICRIGIVAGIYRIASLASPGGNRKSEAIFSIGFGWHVDD